MSDLARVPGILAIVTSVASPGMPTSACNRSSGTQTWSKSTVPTLVCMTSTT